MCIYVFVTSVCFVFCRWAPECLRLAGEDAAHPLCLGVTGVSAFKTFIQEGPSAEPAWAWGRVGPTFPAPSPHLCATASSKDIVHRCVCFSGSSFLFVSFFFFK